MNHNYAKFETLRTLVDETVCENSSPLKRRRDSIRGIVSMLRDQFNLEGSADEVIAQSCEKLGLPNGDKLFETAKRCYKAAFPEENEVSLDYSHFSDRSLIYSQWEAGSAGFTDGTPWVFTADYMFTIDLMGIQGEWQLLEDELAPGRLLLRMDWQSQKSGLGRVASAGHAEFHLQQLLPDANPVFNCVSSSFPFMFNGVTVFTLRCISLVNSAAKPILNEAQFQFAVVRLKNRLVKRTTVGSRSSCGPRPDQLNRLDWFDQQPLWARRYPLHRAAMRGDVAELAALLGSGRDPNEQMSSWQNSSPLHWAAAFNQVHCIEALIEAGGDPRRTNSAGRTAVDEAHRERHDLAGELFEVFLFHLAGQMHAGQSGPRVQEYEENFARIYCPVAGHPAGDDGAYTHPVGCCWYVAHRKVATHSGGSWPLCFPVNLLLWGVTCCYLPCALTPVFCGGESASTGGGWYDWARDCPTSEQRVTYGFVRKHPELIVRGPAKMRRDDDIPTRYAGTVAAVS